MRYASYSFPLLLGFSMSSMGCVGGTKSTTTPVAAGKVAAGKIVYMSKRDDGLVSDIAVMNSNGSNKTRLTRGGTDSRPCFSWDGKQIVFQSRRESQGDIYVMKSDGTHTTRLTRGRNASGPCFSPDARTIAFAVRDGDSSQIYVMNADGTEQTPLLY